MTDIQPSSVPIQQESVQFNQPASESSQFSIGGVCNYLLYAHLPVGSIVHSMLTETQFQSLIFNPSPATWVLADGRSVLGSIYQEITGQTNAPDLRGIFVRGKNNGRVDGNQNPDGDLALGTFTDDKFESHTHGYNGSALNDANSGGVATGEPQFTPVNITNATGGNETAPKNVTVNIFIRIN